jgi:hypothetical protein
VPAGAAVTGRERFTRTAEAQLPSAEIGTAILSDYALSGPVLVGIEKGFFREAGVPLKTVASTIG